MKRPITIAALAALALAGAATQAKEKDAATELAPQASIPFVNSASSIREWQADGENGLWVQDVRRQWYYARLIAPCHGLDFAIAVGFRTRATDTLDRFADVVVPDHGRCAIQSFTKSEAPPEQGRKAKAADAVE